MLRWDRYRFDKKRTGAHYTELVFFHPMGSVGHVVDYSESESRNIDTLFSCSGRTSTYLTKSESGLVMPNLCFCIWWDQLIA
jgi:hypothetical protein